MSGVRRSSRAPLQASVLALLAGGWSTAFPQGTVPAPVPIEKRGPAVGSVAPPIRLQDQGGRERTLETLSGKGGLVLLFVRSADW